MKMLKKMQKEMRKKDRDLAALREQVQGMDELRIKLENSKAGLKQKMEKEREGALRLANKALIAKDGEFVMSLNDGTFDEDTVNKWKKSGLIKVEEKHGETKKKKKDKEGKKMRKEKQEEKEIKKKEKKKTKKEPERTEEERRKAVMAKRIPKKGIREPEEEEKPGGKSKEDWSGRISPVRSLKTPSGSIIREVAKRGVQAIAKGPEFMDEDVPPGTGAKYEEHHMFSLFKKAAQEIYDISCYGRGTTGEREQMWISIKEAQKWLAKGIECAKSNDEFVEKEREKNLEEREQKMGSSKDLE